MKHYRRIGTDIISADQVIGKTLFTRTSVPLKRYAQANAPVVFTVKPGQAVGKVYSWVNDGPVLYWAFYDEKGVPYYAEHKVGRFSVDALQQQGTQTLEDIKEAQQQAENPVTYAIQKMVRPLVLAGVAFLLIKAVK